MTNGAKAYISLVASAAVAVLYSMPTNSYVTWGLSLLLNLLAFVVVGCLAEGMAVDFRLGSGRQAKSSLAFLPFLSAMAIFPPVLAVISVATVVVISQTFIRKTDPFRSVFNVAQAVLASAFASSAYTYFIHDARGDRVSFLGFIIGAGIFFSINIVLNSIAISLLKRQSLALVLSQVAGSRGGNLWYDLLASPIALIPAVLYTDYNVLGLLIIVLPLLLIRYTYSSIVKLEDAFRDLMQVLVKAIETRDPYTSGHSVRVSTLARLVAEDLRLDRRLVRDVEIAALLHDIGKIDPLYAELIRKPHDLDHQERDLIRTHASKGADLLESLTSVNRQIIDAVRHHHEKYDGSGYPAGLSGAAIPLAARIIMLCDSVDAMLSDRPYRRALSIEQAKAELHRCADTQFDPNIVLTILKHNTLEKASRLIRPPADGVVEDSGELMTQRPMAVAARGEYIG